MSGFVFLRSRRAVATAKAFSPKPDLIIEKAGVAMTPHCSSMLSTLFVNGTAKNDRTVSTPENPYNFVSVIPDGGVIASGWVI